ncbi:hypothetical protein M8C21_010321 [Ambrosia artemisiifolia]|uniref:Glycosyl transferase family 1 domain-containing protein n=1 Tax=Ambrosia artemisiifolia TaxID=4212 RepID=A0AAD5CDM8_AMBAR|nr:hypothetical protein M8C21_010321 [Ambrosia artemisiifolia]
MLLPLSTLEQKHINNNNNNINNLEGDLKSLFQVISGLDFGEGVKFEPTKLLLKFQGDSSRKVERFGLRKPQLAFVFADLLVDPQQVLMVSVAAALKAIGYDGILVNSIEAKDAISGLLQEPFKSLPLIWTIHEKTLATLHKSYVSDGQFQLINDWKTVFNRATVVVFPNHVLPMYYAAFDAGNYFVIPGSPSEACKLRSQFLYKGLWVEHALVLRALSPLLAEFPVEDGLSQRLRIVILSQDLTGNYSAAIEEIALNLNYQRGAVSHAAIDDNGDVYNLLSIADLVIHGSFLEEQSFPDILIKAMCFEKPIIAPDLPIIKKYIDDKVNGYVFPKENIKVLTQIMLQLVSKGKLSSLAQNIASTGKHTATNMMVVEAVEGYASLIQNVVNLPSEVASPRAVSEIPSNFKAEWQWRFFEAVADSTYVNKTKRIYQFLNKVEYRWKHNVKESFADISADDAFLYSIWQEERSIQTAIAKKRREDGEVRDRSEQPRGRWEDVYRSAKRAERSKNALHERDDGELERTGQPLCIYEPYFGQGAWPFLHQGSLYRGLGLSTKGRRSRDDIDAPSRLPLLSIPYYRDALGDFGAFFAIANRASLSKLAEVALLDDIQARRHGDALYFWVRMDKDPRNPMQHDFWTFCDAINAGNCRSAFSEALKKMYGVRGNLTSLPPMPADGDSWSVMHSWSMPTKSFLEFVMFSRMFVDALDAEVYEEHHQSGFCYLSLSKDKQCYSRVLELLVNVWAYHSARRMVYIDPTTGTLEEQHNFKTRRGKMWIKWFSYKTLKTMDEDLAEEADSDHPKRRWLWPSTGEVFWPGMYEKERNQMRQQKQKRKQKSKDRIRRIKNRSQQKALGTYVKPPPDNETDYTSNPVLETTMLLR